MGKDTPSHYPPEEFIRQAHRSFQFLRDLGFRYGGAGSEEGDISESFTSGQLSVRVQYDQASGDVDVNLIRAAEDGTFPEYLDNPDHWISLDKLVEYRQSLLGEESPHMPHFDPDVQVRFRANQLLQNGGGLLHGDFSDWLAVRQFINDGAVAAGQAPDEANLRAIVEADLADGQSGQPQA